MTARTLYLSLKIVPGEKQELFTINYDPETDGNWFEEVIPGSTHVLYGLNQEQIDDICNIDTLNTTQKQFTQHELTTRFPFTFIMKIPAHSLPYINRRRSERLAIKKQRQR